MLRSDIINAFINKYSFTSYLEIGVRDGRNFDRINCIEKIGIDPDTSKFKDKRVLQKTSDDYFSEINLAKKFDIIFIDGLHLEHQVDKDIKNSLLHLNDSGVIILHDCNPPTQHHCRENYLDFTPAGSSWNGTVWKSFVKIRCQYLQLERCVVDTDWGCGIIKPSSLPSCYDSLSVEDCLNWENFHKHRKEILNLISIEEFIHKFLN